MNHSTVNLIEPSDSIFKSDQLPFINQNLDKKRILAHLSPIMDVICKRIQATYKSKTSIDYLGSQILDSQLITRMQFDDVCIKLLHVDSGSNLFIILGSRLARTLLIRLLSTSLIDDQSSLPFSPTEKGIFSFIIARIIFDLKNTLHDGMPNFKLLGVYHFHDEAMTDSDLQELGSYNFFLTFDQSIFPITIAVPTKFFTPTKNVYFNKANLLPRCGHLCKPLTIKLKSLSLTQNALQNLTFGDLILFDHSDVTLNNKALQGPIKASWHTIAFRGKILATHNCYGLMLDQHYVGLLEDENMEELEISHDSDLRKTESSGDKKSQLANLAKNIRVNLSIELSRIPMTLKEVCAIKEGEIIDLHRKIDDPLEMVVEGKIIGHCQPVQIEGRLGIRVLEMLGEENEEKM